jgi:hypothetical protein
MMMGVQIPLMSVQIPLWVVLLSSSADFITVAVQSLDQTHQGHTGQDSGHKFQD